MSNNLAPCPFCGKEPEVRYRQETWSTGFLVVCLSCECSDSPAEWETPREAIRDWNQQWANGLISNTLELNQVLTSKYLRLQRENEKLRKKLLKVQFLLDKPRTYRLKIPRAESCSCRVWRLSKMGHSLTPGALETIDIKRAMRHHLKSEYATYLQGLLL